MKGDIANLKEAHGAMDTKLDKINDAVITANTKLDYLTGNGKDKGGN